MTGHPLGFEAGEPNALSGAVTVALDGDRGVFSAEALRAALAAELARGLADIPGVELDPADVETNILIFEVPDADEFLRRLSEHGVAMTPMGPTTVRAVTHLDVDAQGIALAVEAARAVLV